ncbi:MAG: hypothetical protein CM15mP102_19700 [Flavobacteriales bacterium]|nr:MAG: hypothetical protein CM15mP102_19700 [Flavobacteriales bacterium]
MKSNKDYQVIHLLINFNYLNTEDTDMVSGKLIEYLASGSPIINFSNSAQESNIILQNSKNLLMQIVMM